MKNIFICIILGLMIVTTSCKSKDSKESQTKSPIAVYNHNTGVLTNYIDVDMFTETYNSHFASRHNQPLQNRFIIENAELINKKANNIYTTLEVASIDTDEESAMTVWLTDDFLECQTIDNKTYYYIHSDVVSNNYSFCYNVGNIIYIVDVVNGEFSTRKWDNVSTLPPRWFVKCTGHNCNASTCQPYDAGDYYGCTPCSVVDKTHWCEQTNTNGQGLATIIGSIIGAIGAIVGVIFLL